MIIITTLLFYFSIFMVLYIYAGYPLCILALSALFKKRVKKTRYLPSITILIAAYNEEKVIEATIQNKLDLKYPKEITEIIVISDASTDNTDNIVRQYADRGVRLLRQDQRSGKTAALNMAVPDAKGEIIVFSDANSIYSPDAIQNIVQNFSDSSVGYVTGKMVYVDTDGTIIGEGCSTYMRYENYLREIETSIGSVVGVDGGIDAIRKSLYRPMNQDQLPDFVLPLKVVKQGYRVVYEPKALLTEASLKTSEDEYKMRVRVSLRALWALKDMHALLSLNKYTIFAWQLWSHKVLRYSCFMFLLMAYISSFVLWNENSLYKLIFIMQSIAYLTFVIQFFFGYQEQRSKILYLIYYFVLLNMASAHAFLKFLLGQKQVLWTPRKG